MPPGSSDSILVFVDFSEVTRAVADMAMKLASALGKKLLLIHIVTPEADSEGKQMRKNISREAIAAELHRNRHALGLMEAESKRRGVKAVSLLVRGRSTRGNPTAKMLREITRLKPDLIVMGTHGHGPLHNLLLGSASAAVVRKATCPVLLVPSKPQKR